jgi:Fic family protein
MNDEDPARRHSVALAADLITDDVAKAEAEAINGLRQFDRTIDYIRHWLDSTDRPFRLRPSTILDLHRAALDGISAYAGSFRPAGVEILGSTHQPVAAHRVPELIEDLCDYVNANFTRTSALHLAAYLMWRLNWIHPFADGSGRTSRVVSYLVLCVRLGCQLPGTRTIPEQIAADRAPYFNALEAADAADRDGRLDLSVMETLLESLLAAQLLSVIDKAGQI